VSSTASALRALVAARRALRAGAATDDVLRRLASSPQVTAPKAATPEAAAAAVRRASRLVPGATCVPQAIAMASLLSPSSRELAVVLGARRDATGRWIAHAWVEVDQVPWPATGADAFQRLAAYHRSAHWALVPRSEQ
jgi:hypothetical protein